MGAPTAPPAPCNWEEPQKPAQQQQQLPAVINLNISTAAASAPAPPRPATPYPPAAPAAPPPPGYYAAQPPPPPAMGYPYCSAPGYCSYPYPPPPPPPAYYPPPQTIIIEERGYGGADPFLLGATAFTGGLLLGEIAGSAWAGPGWYW
ncbi:hypothetical protein ABPG75_005526 [Micractinium tetrahymenae]